MPEEYDLTLLHPDGKLDRYIAIMRTEIEELHAKLASTLSSGAKRAISLSTSWINRPLSPRLISS
jgi:hypothetical protein